jgi:hypothetical protein
LETKAPEETNTPSIITQRVIVPSYPRNDSGLTKGILEFYGSFYGSIFIGSIAIATVGGLTGFHKGEYNGTTGVDYDLAC